MLFRSGQAGASVGAGAATPSASAVPKPRGQAQRHESVDFNESGGAAILRTYDSPSGNEDGDGAGEPVELSLGRSLMGGSGSGGVGSGDLVGLSSRPLLAQSFSSSSHVVSMRAPSPSPPMRPKGAISKHVPGALVAALQIAAPQQQQQPPVRKPPPSPITVATTSHVGPHTPHTAPASGPRSAASAFHATTSLSRGP